MSEFVIISHKSGDAYHRIGENGHAECGSLTPTRYKPGDSPAAVMKAAEVSVWPATDAEEKGYTKCGRCFRGGEKDG